MDTEPHLEDEVVKAWQKCQNVGSEFREALNSFRQKGRELSENFLYWDRFINEIASVLKDLTRSFREGNWTLHLSSVHQAIKLCFTFDRVNYKRWLPLYYEDCLALPQKYPVMHASFMDGDFVVHHTPRRGSSVPMDQALEKAYNKPAKSQSGIIGVTRRKEAICKWNIFKHDKSKFTSFMYALCALSFDDEYSLHHEYSRATTKADSACVHLLLWTT